ncbi:MAG: DUF6498-containing protein, partial [Chloroflexota bacterium]
IWIGSPVGSLLLLVVLKTGLDLYFHLREHRRAGEREQSSNVEGARDLTPEPTVAREADA